MFLIRDVRMGRGLDMLIKRIGNYSLLGEGNVMFTMKYQGIDLQVFVMNANVEDGQRLVINYGI